jgi:hypothetical protein
MTVPKVPTTPLQIRLGEERRKAEVMRDGLGLGSVADVVRLCINEKYDRENWKERSKPT